MACLPVSAPHFLSTNCLLGIHCWCLGGVQDKNKPGHAIAIHATAMVPLAAHKAVRIIAPPAPFAAVPLAAPAALPLAPPVALHAPALAPAQCEPSSALDAHMIINNLQVRTAPMLCAASIISP